MPDEQRAGGLGKGQRIANLANLYYIPFAPHMVASCQIPLSEKPGIGVDVNEEAMRRYAANGVPFFE